ncbi:hypothetical protein CCACVL1_02825 [Corchorus capsularis]|uniref:Uncharacterized protein n=1 Tax=Corchorus capsularis TaxID=210143 RepID=A0A1R3K5N9_COCAP|nr:hypothetical protein CCACVL1_02825 [Corchorus capsularis]
MERKALRFRNIEDDTNSTNAPRKSRNNQVF